MRKICAFYAILMGAGLIGTWVGLLATGQGVDFGRPIEAWSLLTAEFLTGSTLILGGWGVLTRRSRGPTLHLVSLGMLLYVSIFSIGVFGQPGNVPAAIFFALVAIATTFVVSVQILRAGSESVSFSSRNRLETRQNVGPEIGG